MVQFNTLRLNGFKSFSGRTEIDIGEGLTGIVGPNGCGKSNLVEALRWVMGESSSRRMRGGSTMEDVIFNGTSSRSSRNFAEVSLVLNNRGRSAPAAFNTSDEIEVIRRIERDKGSVYKINSNTVRARDVQMLFADIVVGANSPALVSQGRVTQMILAKPTERRKILEESAGISGLYARRHEAELRLKSTDSNLARLQDITSTQEATLQNLQRQARQARKYKSLSEGIRKTETDLACVEFTQAQISYETSQTILQETETLVASKMLTVIQLTKTHLTQSEGLPELREKTNKVSAAWQVQNLTLQRLEDEEKQLGETLKTLQENIDNLINDQKHEKEMRVENQALLERLKREEERHHGNQSQYKENSEKLLSEKETQSLKVQTLESEYKASLKTQAQQEAQKSTLLRDIEKHQQQWEACETQITRLKLEISVIKQTHITENVDVQYSQEIDNIEETLSDLNKEEKSLREARETLEIQKEEVHTQKTLSNQELTSLETEIRTLKSFLTNFGDSNSTPIIDTIQAGRGMELALSRALGDTLQASLEGNSMKIWGNGSLDIEALPSLPSGLTPLSKQVKAPKELDLALHMVGVAQTYEEAKEAFKSLKTGQSIVTLEGEYLRWDGYYMKAEAKDPQSEFLKQKSLLSNLESDLPKKKLKKETISKKESEIEVKRVTCRQKLNILQSKKEELEEQLKTKTKALEDQREAASKSKETLLKSSELLSFSSARQEELTQTLETYKRDLNAFEKMDREEGKKAQNIEQLKSRLDKSQEQLNDLKIRYEQIQSDNKRRETRLHAIVDERLNVKNKLIRATDQIKKFENRGQETKDKFIALQNRPSEIKNEQETVLNSITELKNRKEDVQNTLNKAEKDLRDTTNALKEAENSLTTGKESRARAHATLEATDHQMRTLKTSIEDQFDLSIEALLREHKASITKEISSLDQLRKQRDSLTVEREKIGPVNLRAAIEAEEIGGQLVELLTEIDELIQAITELRAGIEKLNSEARLLLSQAFEKINAYFQSLFINLFGGGEAYLKLIDSDDPLDAGLEIFAQPPGKSLQSLSLLSGGEQTLTSIALIFAMFLTNPSPICVLDEIDAPLDDANVDRVCDLLEDVSSRGNTRFLVITHHRLTMARMDRLYGVTMAERGISQLVSVDLDKQMSFFDIEEA